MPNTPKTAPQLTLSLFDSTALSGGLTLDGPIGGLRYREPETDDTDPATVPQAPEPARIPARNWRLSGDRALAQGWKARATDNLAAIRLAQAISRDDRNATSEEQEVLCRFTGFGASDLANSLFRRPGEPFRPGWEDLGTELEQLVTPEQMAGLARATQYAHYTPEFIIRAIWGAVTRMGFAGGTVLEPGCGTGLFLALMPESLVGKTAVTAVEMDPCTAQIAALLHPDAWVRGEDFTKARISETFELAIGNPPFSDRTVRASDPAGKLGLCLHDYFIARSIERLKPGGLAAFVTSRYTMDKADETARAHIAGMANLIGAVRLPQGSMMAASGTKVVVDVLFFQKREPGAAPNATQWDSLAEAVPEEDGEKALYVNRYFTDNPVWDGSAVLPPAGRFAAVLGAHGRTSGRSARPTPAGERLGLGWKRCWRGCCRAAPRASATPKPASYPPALQRPASRSAPPPSARPSRRAAISCSTTSSCRWWTARRCRCRCAAAGTARGSPPSTRASCAR